MAEHAAVATGAVSSPMITHQVMHRTRPRSLLLIHGLYTSAGYWLPYLAQLREFRLILLNIDYAGIAALPDYVAATEAIIASSAAGRVDAVLAHSLGCLIAHQLPHAQRRSNYEICPVYCARPLQTAQFVAELGQRIGAPPAAASVHARLAGISRALAVAPAAPDASTIQYLPDADPYFTYDGAAHARHYAGDHFDISAALTSILAELG